MNTFGDSGDQSRDGAAIKCYRQQMTAFDLPCYIQSFLSLTKKKKKKKRAYILSSTHCGDENIACICCKLYSGWFTVKGKFVYRKKKRRGGKSGYLSFMSNAYGQKKDWRDHLHENACLCWTGKMGEASCLIQQQRLLVGDNSCAWPGED